mmetsp:Transcript_38077/g.66775  ORF Transcript_38077/g.66775 Transcript_38077/m.66775 type:complete len:144 (+) Transcript_38077:326-757(+)
MTRSSSDAEEEAFEMKWCKFEMKREDPRRKNRDCERMTGMECEKKVQMAANRKKMNKSCESVNEKRMVSLAVNKIGNKTFENNEKIMSFGSPDSIDADVGSTVAFAGSTSVNFGSPDVFDADNGSIVACAGSHGTLVVTFLGY